MQDLIKYHIINLHKSNHSWHIRQTIYRLKAIDHAPRSRHVLETVQNMTAAKFKLLLTPCHFENVPVKSTTFKICRFQNLPFPKSAVSKVCRFQSLPLSKSTVFKIFRFQNLPFPKSAAFKIYRFQNLPLSKSTVFKIFRFQNLPLSKSTVFKIYRCQNPPFL